MSKFKTVFPDPPCADFYDWYRHIHGSCPVEVRERIDRFGNRRKPETEDQRFNRLISRFAKSLVS